MLWYSCIFVEKEMKTSCSAWWPHTPSMRYPCNTVRSELETLKVNIDQANIRNDDLEQYIRRSCLRKSGVPEENPNEDVHAIVLEIAEQFGADTEAYNYSRCYDLHNMLKGEGSLCYHNHWLAYQGKDWHSCIYFINRVWKPFHVVVIQNYKKPFVGEGGGGCKENV